jgi:hypothetical protein
MTLFQLEQLLGKPTFTTHVLEANERSNGRMTINLSDPVFGEGRAVYWLCQLDASHRIDPVKDEGTYCWAIDEQGQGEWIVLGKCTIHQRALDALLRTDVSRKGSN